VLLALCALLPVAGARGDSGWVGDRYGWRVRGGVQATVDGGRLDAAREARVANAYLAIDWPFVEISAETPARTVAAVWTSSDGGRTWQVLAGS
jgi:hypothetical protein